jgi:hypothetical protein
LGAGIAIEIFLIDEGGFGGHESLLLMVGPARFMVERILPRRTRRARSSENILANPFVSFVIFVVSLS